MLNKMLRLRNIEPSEFDTFGVNTPKVLNQVDCLALEYVGIALVDNYNNEYNEYDSEKLYDMSNLFVFQNEQLYTIDDGILGYDTDNNLILVLNRIFVSEKNQVILEVHNLTNSFSNENIACNCVSEYNDAILDNINNLEFHMAENYNFNYYLVTI